MAGHLEGDVLLRDVVAISLDASEHKSLFLRFEEFALLWELWDSWPTSDTD